MYKNNPHLNLFKLRCGCKSTHEGNYRILPKAFCAVKVNTAPSIHSLHQPMTINELSISR
ncbi:protein of unknown function [Legionella fallonii LLAP-10]|uniref:Uncharacterized protein n=1 Tax=Legionella fallonii LLAP-10 TaxID=1212491 RepID=A0A098G342_9GAMM|nr:protein of unknown function [Legionella fallonii LLAP-10]